MNRQTSTQDPYGFEWNELAFGSKKPVSSLNATFIAAARKMSVARLKQLIKTYLPNGNIVFGIAKEPFVQGLEDNPAFHMLAHNDLQELVEMVNAKSPKFKLYTLQHFQRDLPFLLDKLSFRNVVLVRGSWYTSFHQQHAYYTLANKHVPFEYVSPFADENEAKLYAQAIAK